MDHFPDTNVTAVVGRITPEWEAAPAAAVPAAVPAQSDSAPGIDADAPASLDSADEADSFEPGALEEAGSQQLGEFAGEPAFEDFAAVLRNISTPPELLHAIFEGFSDTADHSARDAVDRQETVAELREVWGDQYDANVAAIRAYLQHSLPPGVGDLVMSARINGRALLNSAQVAYYLQSAATSMPVIPSTGDDARDIAAIENLMATEPQGYRRDLGLQARLRSLYTRRRN